ncbi:MAG: adenylosuccinate synthase [Fimbriimonadaceae bacterium]|nr:adenylosuccinate synthase [Fimbriimonadaceae bacterium]
MTQVIVGAQWGDEAKGKIVDFVSDRAEFVVRYSGGNNAGHTVVANGKEFKFHLLPAGVLHPGTTSILAAGMVVCPRSLVRELDETRAKQPELGKVVISRAAHVVLPYHMSLDALEEDARGKDKIGTTSRGIGPAYTDKVQRSGIRMAEFVDEGLFRARLQAVLDAKERLFSLFGQTPPKFDDVFDEYRGYADQIRPYVGDAEQKLQDAVAAGKRVLMEGAQGTFLDLDLGTYPFVTSSHPVAGGACIGTGIGPRDIQGVLGVCKAYSTRVGTGPFPTELLDDTGEQIRQQGNEFGTTTGRPRRCGWLDVAALRFSARANSFSGLVITRLDVLSGLGALQVATRYRLDGKELAGVPMCSHEWGRVEPVYETLVGWEGEMGAARALSDLPRETQDYVRFIEEAVGVPAAILSIGPGREQTIVLRPDLVWG